MVIYLSPGIFAQDCLSLRKLLLHFSVMHVPREKCVQARAYIHKQSVGLEKNISQRDLLLVVMTVWWLNCAAVHVSAGQCIFFFILFFFSYCKTISLPVHYLSQSAIRALPFASLHNFPWWFLTACVKFDCMKPSLIWTGTVLPQQLYTHYG